MVTRVGYSFAGRNDRAATPTLRGAFKDITPRNDPPKRIIPRTYRQKLLQFRSVILLFCFAVAVYWLSGFFFLREEPWEVSSIVEQDGHQPRKAVIIASFKAQDVSWIDELSGDWEIYRYIMDDFFAPLHVPRNIGREAMAYLTFIINHYDNLPDHMVFVHGHAYSWHQPEPLAWKLDSLNFTALDEDQFVQLRCHQVPTARPEYLVDFRKNTWELGVTEKIIPDFWRMTNISDTVPETLAFPCCAQFATTKKATLARSLHWWMRFRDPMMRDPRDLHFNMTEDELYMLEWIGWGYVYEKLWHVAFGMPPVFIPNEQHCFRTQWSDGVHCNRYPTPPFGNNYPLLKGTYCWKTEEDDPEEDYEYQVWSMCNDTAWIPERPVWYATDPGQPGHPREDPCPGFDVRAHALSLEKMEEQKRLYGMT